MFSISPVSKRGSCLKCHGAMILDLHEFQGDWYHGLRCIQCGKRAPWIISGPPERPLPKKWERPINHPIKRCPECANIFKPVRNGRTYCQDPKCLEWKKSRGGYLGALIRYGMDRDSALKKSFERYPGLKDKSTMDFVGGALAILNMGE